MCGCSASFSRLLCGKKCAGPSQSPVAATLSSFLVCFFLQFWAKVFSCVLVARRYAASDDNVQTDGKECSDKEDPMLLDGENSGDRDAILRSRSKCVVLGKQSYGPAMSYVLKCILCTVNDGTVRGWANKAMGLP